MMKQLFRLILTAVMLCSLLSVAAAEEPLATFYCAEQGFSIQIPSELTTVYKEDTGVQIFTGNPGYIPYVIIFRRPLEAKFKDPVNYLNNVYREHMENTYGGNMIGMNPCKEYEVGGKTLLGARYLYKVQDTTICLLRLIEAREDGDVEYTAKYVEGSGDATLTVLEIAAQFYQPDGGTL